MVERPKIAALHRIVGFAVTETSPIAQANWNGDNRLSHSSQTTFLIVFRDDVLELGLPMTESRIFQRSSTSIFGKETSWRRNRVSGLHWLIGLLACSTLISIQKGFIELISDTSSAS